MKEFLSKWLALKEDVSQNQKIYCLQAHVSTFQPGNFTGWGSEGVNVPPFHTLHPHTYLHTCWCIVCVFSLLWKSDSKKNCHCKNSKILSASLTSFKLIAWHCRFSFLFQHYSTWTELGAFGCQIHLQHRSKFFMLFAVIFVLAETAT